MSEIITKVVKIGQNAAANSTYSIGALASNVIYQEDTGPVWSLSSYLNNLKGTVSGIQSNINSINSTVTNISNTYATKSQLNQQKGNLESYINNDRERLTSLESTRTTFTNYFNNIGTPSASTRWDGTLVPGISTLRQIEHIDNETTLAQISGKFNYLRSCPFVVLRYSVGSQINNGKKINGNNIYIHKFNKTSFKYINEISRDQSTLPTASDVINKYKLVCVLFPQVRGPSQPAFPNPDTGLMTATGKISIYPQRAFIDSDGNPVVVVANQNSTAQTIGTLNIRVLAVLKE